MRQGRKNLSAICFSELLSKYKIEMGKNYHLGWVFKPLGSGLVTSKSVWSQAGSSGGWAEAQLPSGLVMTLSSDGKKRDAHNSQYSSWVRCGMAQGTNLTKSNSRFLLE